ncbi:MAG: hydrogenase nickel incorporation protein HypB [Ignavibacteria bacterium]|nr:hydrogenase nickel incorporation protein HypB [Ignavibacteria bacterium]
MSVITIERKILEKNDELAQQNRKLFEANNIFVINIISSPGSGKTSILEKSLEYWKGSISVSVIEGDVQTDFDAQRIAKHHIPVVQIVTNGACHLDAKLIQDALKNISFETTELLIIEHVGNLVCPAAYDLGETFKVVVVSVTEGEDKPLKYPAIFRTAAVLLINKTDLLPHLQFDITLLKNNALRINPRLLVFEISCMNNKGISQWCEWLRSKIVKK